MRRLLSMAALFGSLCVMLGMGCHALADPAGNDAGQSRERSEKSGLWVSWNSVEETEAIGRYTKLGYGGSELPETAAHVDEGGPWIITRDNETGLIWEVKTATEGLRYRANTYTWFDPNPETNGGYDGTPNGGDCTGSACDTGSYIEALNVQKFGGFSDWRMPNVRELGSLVNTETYNPAIDTRWFPNTMSHGYWSSTTYVLDSTLAWVVPFYHGLVNHYGSKSGAYHVRAVRKENRSEVAFLSE